MAMATSLFSRPNQPRRSKRHIVDQHPSNATLVPEPDEPESDDDDDFRSISIAPSNASASASRHLRSTQPGNYPIFDDLLPSDVRQLGPPSARGYHTTSQYREKPFHAPSISDPQPQPQKRASLSLKGVGKILRRTFSRKHSSAPHPTTKRVPSLAPAPAPRSFHNHNPNPIPIRLQATEVMDVNIPDEDTHLPLFANPQDHTGSHQHTSALGRRATAPPPRRPRSSRSQSIRSFASSERVSLSNQHPMHPHTSRLHAAGLIDPNHPHPGTGTGTRLFVPQAATAAVVPMPQRKRIFTGPWYNRRGDMWIGVGPGPNEFRAMNTNEMTFHPNFQNYPSEHGHFMNAEGDVMDAVQLRMIRRADS